MNKVKWAATLHKIGLDATRVTPQFLLALPQLAGTSAWPSPLLRANEPEIRHG